MSETALVYPELASCLRELAGDYFDGDHIEHRSGICLALRDYMYSQSDAYHAMTSVMEELGYKSAYFGPSHVRRESWEPRAYMCLFLAEYLEASV